MRKILIVLPSHDRFPSRNYAAVVEFSQLTMLVARIAKYKFSIDFASVAGGHIDIDMAVLSRAVNCDLAVLSEINDAFVRLKSLDEIFAAHYAAVIYLDGLSALYDYPDNHENQRLVQQCYESDKWIAAVGYGVSALLNVRLSNNEYLLSGKLVTCKPYEESVASEETDAMPFNLEAKVMNQGAQLAKAPASHKKVVSCERIITAQNVVSLSALSERLMTKLLSVTTLAF